MTENIPQEEVNTSSKKTSPKRIHHILQKIKKGSQKIHLKIGIYGWIAAILLIVLISTIIHYERKQEYHWESKPHYIYYSDDWIRDIDRDFENMHRQMDAMRARHERMMRDIWSMPMDMERATTSSFISNGSFQYSLNTNNGKLDGFISASAEDIQKLLPQIQKLGLTVEQKDNRLFLSGDAKVANELLKLLK